MPCGHFWDPGHTLEDKQLLPFRSIRDRVLGGDSVPQTFCPKCETRALASTLTRREMRVLGDDAHVCGLLPCRRVSLPARPPSSSCSTSPTATSRTGS